MLLISFGIDRLGCQFCICLGWEGKKDVWCETVELVSLAANMHAQLDHLWAHLGGVLGVSVAMWLVYIRGEVLHLGASCSD